VPYSQGHQFDVDGAVNEWLPVFEGGGDDRRDILQILLRLHIVLDVAGVVMLEFVGFFRLIVQSAFLGGGDGAGVDFERYAIPLSQMLKQGLLTGAGGILPDRPATAIGVAAEVVVGLEFYRAGQDHVDEVVEVGGGCLLGRCFFLSENDCIFLSGMRKRRHPQMPPFPT
jgi:hypothetical protein